MSNQVKIKINKIIESQIPGFIAEENENFVDFLKQYYIAQEYFGGPIDIARNVNEYKKLDYISESKLIESTTLTSNITYFEETIPVTSTHGYPEEYGLLKIDNEIITYTGKTNTTFTGCIRGFSGVEKLGKQGDFNELVFSQTSSSDHVSGSVVTNLSNLFLKEFFTKLKTLYSPGFEDRDFYSGLNDANFIKQVKDFYKSKGTEESFKILFRVLYGEPVEVVNPSKYLFTPSSGNWTVSRTIVCESISGDPKKLKGSTISNESGTISAVVSNVFSLRSSNKLYYKIQLDRDTVFIDFEDTPKTFCLDKINSSDSIIYVDSTIGFPNSGQLLIKSDEDSTVVNYSNKTLNEFIGCSGIGLTSIGKSFDYFAIAFNNKNLITGIDNEGNEVVLSISSLISDLDVQEDNHNFLVKDTINIKSIGYDVSDDLKFTQWIYNVRSSHKVKSIVSQGGGQYLITLADSNHLIKNSNELELVFDNSVIDATTLNVDSLKRVQIYTADFIDITKSFYIRRKLTKSSGVTDRAYLTDVEATYLGSDGNVYVSSAALPSHEILATNRSKTFNISNVNLDSSITVTNHQFLTGEEIYYQPVSGNPITGITTSSYFIKKINEDLIELYQSRNDIYTNKKILLSTDSGSISITHQITPKLLENKFTTAQNLLKKIPSVPSDKKTLEKITSEDVGILVNGVEIFSSKANRSIFYGPLEDVKVLRSNDEFDVVNTPKLKVNSNNEEGSGAELIPHVNGSFRQVIVDNPGFDFLETPNVSIKGGNGTNFSAEVVLKRVQHVVTVSADSSNVIGIGTTVSTITFNNHEFETGDSVVYNSLGFTGLAVSTLTGTGNIQTNDILYIGKVDNNTFKLYETEDNALSGINTITILNYSNGNNSFRLTRDISKIDSIIINDPGINYRNNTIQVDSNQYPIDNFTDTVSRLSVRTGINTFDNYIFAKNHGFANGDLISYQTAGTSISGLSTSNQYYVVKVDNDKFSLCNAGNENEFGTLNYDQKNIVNLNSVGVGTHTFRYPEIKVSVIGQTSKGIVSLEQTPIVRGKIENVFIYKGGTKYGASDIINYHLRPSVSVLSGSGAAAGAIIKDSKINSVYITNYGKGYTSPPEIVVLGDGTNAVLRATIDSDTGRLSGVSIVNPGNGYSYAKIRFIPQGSLYTKVLDSSGRVVDIKIQDVRGTDISASFKSSVKKWTFDLFRRYFKTFNSSDDGLIVRSSNVILGNKYCNVFPSRKLRYQVGDNINVDGSEVNNPTHSPILGWAYDGNPIYGPYGYEKKTGGSIKQLKSGYVEESSKKSNRPPSYPPGFFVEDFTYFNSSDDLVLDENNGRFCITPEFPNGVYAYFATLNLSPDSSGVFANYKRPNFPYIIGNSYYSKPIDSNFNRSLSQDSINLNATYWRRNTKSYEINKSTNSYDYLTIPNSLSQTTSIRYASPGSVQSVGVVTGGSNYKVNDRVIFNNEGTSGSGANAIVSIISGKPVSNISVATSSIFNTEFYPVGGNGDFLIFAENPHNYNTGDVVSISGVSTTNSLISGSYSAGIATNSTYILNVGVGSTAITGFVTYFSVSGNLLYPSLSENDILRIEQEQLRVLNVDQTNSRIRVLRAINGTVGVSHTSSTLIYQAQRRISVNVGYRTSFDNKINREIYFNPLESVALGNNYGVGIGTTISFSNPGFGVTQVYIPTKSIYLPNHGLKTGDRVTYLTNSGTPIGVSTNGISTSLSLSNNTVLYIAKVSNDLIGISTVQVGLGSTGNFVGVSATTFNDSTLFFTSTGSGDYHSFKTDYDNVLRATVSRNLVTVSTSQTHGLANNDLVRIDVNPSISTSYTIKYNDNSRRILINPKSFANVGVNTSTGEITIQNHGFYTGQKVLHTSASGFYGLKNNEVYYVVSIDKNRFKLSDTYENSIRRIPNYIGITSAYGGEISPINPPIQAYRNSTITFDLSDSSLSFVNQSNNYSAFELNFYKDKNFTEAYDTSESTAFFNVNKYGTVGVSSDARVVLSVNENTPNLYYKFDLVNTNSILPVKKEIVVDKLVPSYNEIIVQSSIFAGDHFVTVSSGTTFTYTLSQTPENVEYNSTTSSISYKTNSLSAYGGISSVRVKTGGLNYISLPGISTQLSSDLGTGAILEPSSSNIGALKTFRIDDIGFDFPSDFTIRPKPNLPKICKIDQLASFESIGVTSFGRGYTVAPKLIVLDGKTRQLVSEVDLKYTLGNSIVEIRKNTFGINNVRPTILPINNSNGVGISNISYNDTTKDVTVTLAVGFSTADSFPFAVNDRILIENISVGVGSTGKGFNSEDYGYSLFTVKSVAKNIGGIGIVTYSLDKFIKSGEYPGNFNATNSSGRIIPEKYLVKFDPILKVNKYLKNEIIKKEGFGEIGFVGNWDSNNAILRLNTDTNLKVGDVLEGKSSFTKGIIKKIDTFRSDYRIDYYSLVKNGWGTEIGFLSNNLQRIPDNDYYQNFSYSLKSRVDYDSWNDVVSSLNHTVGYKKFSDLQMESIVPQRDSRRMVVGIPTNVPSIEVTTDIIGYASLNCVYNFDLASENALVSNSNVFSDEIIFANRILTDYAESVGNRVLIIDDISGQFNSNPRPTKFSEVSRFSLGDARCKKYITYVQDKRYIGERQLMLVSLLYDNEGGTFINQYGRLETQYDLGSFDFYTSGSEGVLTFYPVKYTVNDYNVSSLSYNLQSTFSGIGSTNLGGSVLLNSSSTQINSGMVKTIVTTPLDYTSTKVILAITGNNGQYEFNELSLVHNGTSFEFLEYGQLTNYSLSSVPGLGTYYPYISGSNLKIDFTPTSGIGVTVNTLQVSIGNTSLSGVGTINFRDGKVSSSSVSAASTSSPVAIDVASYSDEYDAAYLILQVSDTTNNRHQVSEVIVIDDGSETYYSEFGTLETTIGLGTVGSYRSGNDTIVTFTPISGIDVEIKSFINGIRNPDDDLGDIFVNFNNSSIESDYGVYTGTETDIRRSFDLRHNNQKIFKRDFDGSNPDVVSVDENTVRIGSHFFVTGEELIYTHEGNPIGIVTTNFVGIGTTDKLPSTVFAIKVDDSNIKLASSAENALKTQPLFVDITSVGIGTSHSFTSKNQNQKVIIAIDNIIQSPLVATALTTSLERAALSVDDIIYFAGITSFFGGDLIKINNEVMRIDSVGIGSTNAIQVKRPWMGSVVSGHSTGSLVTKVTGSYNIIDNTINFVEAPYGNIPIGSTTNPPDERDWVGISTGSSFQGRTFLRSGIKDTSNETYYKNYVFDDISSGFNGLAKSFTLKSNRSDVSGIANENAIVLVNDIFQGPGLAYDYRLSENSGITTITFTGTASSVSYDPNNANIPVGGVIVSVGSTAGFGYQPLISAGGTVTVSSAGTISNISIGNSGSGYRSSSKYQIYTNTSNLTSIGSTIINIENKNSIFKVLEFNNTGSNCTVSIGTYVNSSLISVGGTFIAVGTANTSGYVIPSGTNVIISVNNPQIGIVNVSVGKTNVGISSLTHVGVATIYNGNVLSPVYVTNGGIGYTSGISTISNSPFAFFDAPLSYSNIPLVYSSSSSGVGTQATIDIVVGQGSSVIDFEVKNTGYGYGQNETLTIPVGGVVGIPTTSGFREFQLTIQKTANDKFTGWSVGELQVIDKLDNLFDGSRKIFPILIGGNLTSIRSSPGSNIDVQATLLIFINDILQVPGEGYIFNGGSNITFTEAPKPGDTSKIIFYKGSGSVDVVVKNIIETVKVGDGLILGYDPYQGQSEILQEEERVVTSINSIDNVNTNPYFGPGNSPDETLFRNIVWCRQTEDKIINEKIVGKERELYEPLVYPVANIIRSVGVGETVIYVENVRPLFNSINENDTSLLFQNSITLISQDNKVGASATAIVSVAGTITSIQITNGGSGYVTTPTVTIQDSVGIGTTTPVKATAIASITSGIVTSISISNPGAGYTTSNPPLVLIESPSVITETNSVNSYEGDFGIISGISTISVGVASTGLVFDFVIDKNSILRDSFITGFTSVSGISTGYYFVINNSNVGSGLTSLDSSNQIVGVGTQFIDNVYQVASVSIAQTSVVGLGLTYVAKVVVSVSNYNNLNGIGYSSYYGDYSWGKITLSSRNESQAFAAQTNNGYTGLSTGSLVSREIPLKSSNYIS